MRMALGILAVAIAGLVWWGTSGESARARLRKHQDSEQSRAMEHTTRETAKREPAKQELREQKAREQRGTGSRDSILKHVQTIEDCARSRVEKQARFPGIRIGSMGSDTTATRELIRIGAACIPDVIQLLGSEYDRARFHATWVLEELAPAAAPALIRATRDPNARVRVGVARALKGAADSNPEAFDALVALLQDPDSDVRAAALVSLAAFGKRAAPIVALRLKSRDAYAAAEAFSDSVELSAAAASALIDAISHPQAPNRICLAVALRKLGDEGAPYADRIAQLLADEDSLVADAAVEALVGAGEAAIEPLREATHSDEGKVRARAMDALSRIKRAAEAMVPLYHSKLASDDEAERAMAGIALARRNTHLDDALPVVEEILWATDWERTVLALQALRRCQSERSRVIQLVYRFIQFEYARLKRDKRIELGRSSVYLEIPRTLAALGAANPRLLTAGLEHESGDVRRAAAEALKQIGETATPSSRR